MVQTAAFLRSMERRDSLNDEEIKIRAVVCIHCGEILDEELRRERAPKPPQRWSPGTLSLACASG